MKGADNGVGFDRFDEVIRCAELDRLNRGRDASVSSQNHDARMRIEVDTSLSPDRSGLMAKFGQFYGHFKAAEGPFEAIKEAQPRHRSVSVHPLETFLADCHAVRTTGANAPETSFYPALSTLFNEVGRHLKSKVRCVMGLKDQGPVCPTADFSLSRSSPRGAASHREFATMDFREGQGVRGGPHLSPRG
jgi:hypothetical protein